MKKILFFILVCNLTIGNAQIISSAQIDSLAELTLKTFDVPGIAVAVVKEGKVIHAKGYGVRSLNNKLPVDENTLFGIASNSKAFTAAALGMMVDEGKLKWDDKVIDYIPAFRMYDPYVTDAFTIRDLLTHRSGLGLGAGDLMFFPDGNKFTKEEMISNIRYPSFKKVGFRTRGTLGAIVVALLVFIVTIQFRYVMPVLLFSIYLLYGMIRPWISLKMRKEIEVETEPDEESGEESRKEV